MGGHWAGSEGVRFRVQENFERVTYAAGESGDIMLLGMAAAAAAVVIGTVFTKVRT